MQFSKRKNSLFVELDSSIYNLDVIHKCFYWYLESYSVEIYSSNRNNYSVKITPKENIQISDLKKLKEKIKLDLIDFKCRDIVTKETQNVKDLIIAKAFSNIDIKSTLSDNFFS